MAMKRDNSNVEDQAARLPPEARARLALRLIESLDPVHDEDADALWAVEAERRLRDYDSGRSDAVDAEEALDEIERELK